MNKSIMKYIGKRLLMSVITLFVIVLILFILMKLMPGTPFNDEKLTEAQRVLLYKKYGLDKSVFEQFFLYVKNLLKGDFGVSYSILKNAPISMLLGSRIGITIRIGLQSVVFGSIVGVLLGIVAAMKHNTIWDNISTFISVLGVSIPSFVFALILLIAFGREIPIFPITYDSSQPILSSILPTIALSTLTIAQVARFTRSEMIEVLDSDYMLLAEAKGLNKRTLIFKHALRNTLISIITILAPLIVGLMTGSAVIEKICGIPGIGSLLVEAITANDYNVVITLAFIYSAMYIGIMLVVDVLYSIIDPRIRLSKEDGNE
ncbi:MAG: ABC transporter permease [Erysipelotrichaceae bacterium]|nr:ABC transporter permease [Erysipelotrichaceae bacterium]